MMILSQICVNSTIPQIHSIKLKIESSSSLSLCGENTTQTNSTLLLGSVVRVIVVHLWSIGPLTIFILIEETKKDIHPILCFIFVGN